MMMMNMNTHSTKFCCSPKSHLHVASTLRTRTMTTNSIHMTSLTFKPHYLSPLLRSRSQVIRSAAVPPPPPELTPAGRFFQKLSEPILKVLQKLPAFQQTSEPVLKVFQNLPEYTPATLSALFVVFLVSLAFKLLKDAKKDDSKSTQAEAEAEAVVKRTAVFMFLAILLVRYGANLMNELYSAVFVKDVMQIYPGISIWNFLLKTYQSSPVKAYFYGFLILCGGAFVYALANMLF